MGIGGRTPRPRVSARRVALAVVALAVTAFFGYIAVRGTHPDEVWRSLRDANIWWLFPSFAVLAVANVVRALRWQALYAPERRPPLGPVTASMLIGLAVNMLLPLRAGEAARILALGRSAGVSRVETFATVALERVLDVFCLILLLFAALPLLPEVEWLRPAAVLALLLAVALVVLAIVGERPFHALGRRFPRVEHAWHNLARGLVGLRHPRIAATGFVLTCVSWLLVAFSFWLAMLAFDLGLSPAAGLLTLAAVGLSMILPAAPASLGVFEAAVVIALGAYDVPRSEALSYAFVLHALNLFPYLAAGAVAVRFTRPAR
jgi:glycosyltransferase 2 family protein